MSGGRPGELHGHVFISYVREDLERVDRLQAVLVGAGFRVWRDTADIWPGQDWRLEIRDAIQAGSLVFIGCFSENSERRETSYQNQELILAVEQMRARRPGVPWLIPVRFADCRLPAFDLGAGRMLDSLQHIDLFDGDWERDMPRLIGAVHRVLGGRDGGTVNDGAADDAETSPDRFARSGGGHVPAQPVPDEEGLAAAYDRGLAALYTEQWDDAVEAFLIATAGGRGYKDSERRLEQARRGQGIPAQYATACRAADAGQWVAAVGGFEAVEAAEPGYRDVLARLERARREHARAEVAELHRAGRWQDVLDAGQRLRALSPGDPDPDGLIASARAELAADHHARVLAATYQRALQHISVGEWVAAFVDLTGIEETDPGYQYAAQLADRARRELARTRPQVDHAVRVSAIGARERFIGLAFGPDDARLALGSNDKINAVIMDLGGREHLRVRHDRPKGEYSFVSAVAFDPSGGRLFTYGSDDSARIWDTVSGAQLLKLSDDRMHRAAFSADGKMIATVGSYDDCAAVIWDAGNGKEMRRVVPPGFTGRFGLTFKVEFSHTGKNLVTGSHKTVWMWDLATCSKNLELIHPAIVNDTALSPDGRMLATACDDKIARIWDTASGRKFLEIPHSHPIYSAGFSPDGRMLATASGGAVRIWDCTTGGELVSTPPSGVDKIAFSHDGQLVAATGHNDAGHPHVYVWRLAQHVPTP